mmetsp:Transcript_36355/g.120391  ORF Transcript_36355/g.120391 Transcript_36355/m.120391 type:complete len:262 (+) Transcript_36355:2512-3297(+)
MLRWARRSVRMPGRRRSLSCRSRSSSFEPDCSSRGRRRSPTCFTGHRRWSSEPRSSLRTPSRLAMRGWRTTPTPARERLSLTRHSASLAGRQTAVERGSGWQPARLSWCGTRRTKFGGGRCSHDASASAHRPGREGRLLCAWSTASAQSSLSAAATSIRSALGAHTATSLSTPRVAWERCCARRRPWATPSFLAASSLRALPSMPAMRACPLRSTKLRQTATLRPARCFSQPGRGGTSGTRTHDAPMTSPSKAGIGPRSVR